MTSITLKLTGAHAWATVRGPLTSGMVGIPVTIEYDGAWDGLTKNLMCRCSPWDSDDGEIRTILNVGETATVAHEVMRPDMYLYLGVEGFRDDGTLVIPTTWAKCGRIEYGANTGDDPSTDPELSVWNQIMTEMEQIRQDVIPPELVDEIRGYARTASEAAASAAGSNISAVSASNTAVSKAAAARNSADIAQTAEENAKTSAGSAANLANGALQAQRAAEAAAERAEAAASVGALSDAQIDALDGMFRVCAFVREDVSAEYGAFRTAFGLDPGDAPEKTLTGISAVYTGGSVPVGTAVAALTIVVTAHYSDGTSKAVTGYTLSGTIAEGENTVTVSYGGFTATVTVVGESVDDGAGLPHYELSWDNPGKVVTSAGGFEMHGSYNSTGYIDLDDSVSALTVHTDPVGLAGPYVGFFTADGIFLERRGESRALLVCDVPDGAARFILSVMTTVTNTIVYKGVVTADQIGGAA